MILKYVECHGAFTIKNNKLLTGRERGAPSDSLASTLQVCTLQERGFRHRLSEAGLLEALRSAWRELVQEKQRAGSLDNMVSWLPEGSVSSFRIE